MIIRSPTSLLRNKSATLTFDKIIEIALTIFVVLLIIWIFLPLTIDLYKTSANQMNYAHPLFLALWSNIPVIFTIVLIFGVIIALIRYLND